MGLINYFSKIKKLKKTLRFIFIPETIGSIAYLSKNIDYLKKNVIGGYNLSCLGDERQYSCMLTKYEDTPSDYALIEAFKKLKLKFKKYSFLKRGSDERQYCAQGVELPVCGFSRTKYGEFKEYHTSDDNFSLVTKKGIAQSFKIIKKAIETLCYTIIPESKIICEPS